MIKELRALSWKQPFASLMLYGKVETRRWATKYRGEVLICASKKPYSFIEEAEIEGDEQFGRISMLLNDMSMPLGMAIAVGTLIDCRPMTKQDEDACFVKYHPDLYCHIYDNVRPIEHIPFKGVQGWKILHEEFWDQINFI